MDARDKRGHDETRIASAWDSATRQARLTRHYARRAAIPPPWLRGLRETVRRMLKENGAPPAGKWTDIAVLEPVRDYKARHASTLLTFDAVTNAIDQIEAKRRAAMAAE